ncbi:hypothetical protein F4X88_03720 [Candidatus Poribacteria bacterium]|nr:hypothetical protein [Candidatus Poribacteria bacterium]MYA55383.1 hypothetical protein [Candidatus Poribacteria bacterium]
MDTSTAKELLTSENTRKPSEIAKVIDTLYRELGTYKAIAEQVGRSESFWGVRHRIFGLPVGIQWKIDEGQIGIEQGYQISRLKNEEDQWLLAVAIIETKDLTAEECQNVVNLVLKEEKSIREALGVSAGIRFDKIQPLLLPLGFDIRLAICKRSWARYQDWKDLAYQFILQGIDVDIKEVASQLEILAMELHTAGETQQGSNAAKHDEQECP